MLPERAGLTPSYEQKAFPSAGRLNQLRLVASRAGTDGSLTIHTDASIYLAEIEAQREVRHTIAPGRHVWLQVLRGSVSVNDIDLATSYGIAISDEAALAIHANEAAEVMLFDLV